MALNEIEYHLYFALRNVILLIVENYFYWLKVALREVLYGCISSLGHMSILLTGAFHCLWRLLTEWLLQNELCTSALNGTEMADWCAVI
jgi:hypothetical protein